MSSELSHEFRRRLQQELVSRCKRNPSYSVRAFAQSLNVDSSTLNKILNGQRKLGSRAIQKLALKLGLKGAELERVLNPIVPVGPVTAAIDYQQFNLDNFAILSEWYYMAILELMTVDHFESDPKWIAKALGLPLTEAQLAVERLQRVGLIEVDAKGKWIDRSSGRTTSITPESTDEARRRLQKQILERAIAAIDEVDVTERDQTTITMAVDRSKLPEARERIKKFRRELAQFMCRGTSRDDVYNLSVSLYPLTNLNQTKAPKVSKNKKGVRK